MSTVLLAAHADVSPPIGPLLASDPLPPSGDTLSPDTAGWLQ